MTKNEDGDNGKSMRKIRRLAKSSPQDQGEAVLKDLSHNIGCISRHTVEGIKEVINTDTCKKAGKNIGAFYNHVEDGWENPEKIFAKEGIDIKGTSSFGQIMGSGARSGITLLNKTYKVTSEYVGKAYKKGRVAALIGMWKIEHPKASRIKEQEAVNDIKRLFKA